MTVRYGPNKLNSVIILARVTKRECDLLIHTGREKKTAKHERKAKRQEYKHAKSKIMKKDD